MASTGVALIVGGEVTPLLLLQMHLLVDTGYARRVEEWKVSGRGFDQIKGRLRK